MAKIYFLLLMLFNLLRAKVHVFLGMKKAIWQ